MAVLLASICLVGTIFVSFSSGQLEYGINTCYSCSFTENYGDTYGSWDCQKPDAAWSEVGVTRCETYCKEHIEMSFGYLQVNRTCDLGCEEHNDGCNIVRCCKGDYCNRRAIDIEQIPLVTQARACSGQTQTLYGVQGNITSPTDSSQWACGYDFLTTTAPGYRYEADDDDDDDDDDYYYYYYNRDMRWPVNGNYPNHADCSWRITAPPGMRIVMRFPQIDIEHSSGCYKDNLTLYDGESEDYRVLQTLCDRNVVYQIISSSNVVFVRFRSDDWDTGAGFNMEWEAENATNTEGDTPSSACGINKPEVLRGNRGSFHSPRASLSLPTYWRGTKSTPYWGWEETTVSPDRDQEENYPNNADCEWRIEVPYAHAVEVDFYDIDIEGSFPSCRYDRLQFYDIVGTTRMQREQNFCGRSRHLQVRSRGPVFLVKFHTDGSVARRGFRASYRAVRAQPQVMTTPSPDDNTHRLACTDARPMHLEASRYAVGSFHSPFNLDEGNSSRYPNNANCSWEITAPYGQRISLQFSYIEMECDYDYIEIFDNYHGYRNRIMGPVCRSSPELDNIVSRSNSLLVTFRSDSSVTYRGFLATYSVYDGSDTTYASTPWYYYTTTTPTPTYTRWWHRTTRRPATSTTTYTGPPLQRVRCYSCTYTRGGHGWLSSGQTACINPGVDMFHVSMIMCDGGCKESLVGFRDGSVSIYRTCDRHCINAHFMDTSGGKHNATTCCNYDDCNSTPMNLPTPITTDVPTGTPTTPGTHTPEENSTMYLCYQCDYRHNGKTEVGQECLDPAKYNDMIKIPCANPCMVVNMVDSSGEYASITRSCSFADQCQNETHTYTVAGKNYQRTCCNGTLCNAPEHKASTATSYFTSSVLMGLFVVITMFLS